MRIKIIIIIMIIKIIIMIIKIIIIMIIIMIIIVIRKVIVVVTIITMIITMTYFICPIPELHRLLIRDPGTIHTCAIGIRAWRNAVPGASKPGWAWDPPRLSPTERFHGIDARRTWLRGGADCAPNEIPCVLGFNGLRENLQETID